MNYHNKIKFNLKRFCGELGNYIFSRVNPEKERMQFFNIDITEEYYGFSIYNKLFDILNSPNENFNIAFTGLYNFMLHKGFLEERFIYINNLYNHPDNFYLSLKNITRS